MKNVKSPRKALFYVNFIFYKYQYSCYNINIRIYEKMVNIMKLFQTKFGKLMFDDEDYIRFMNLTAYNLIKIKNRLAIEFKNGKIIRLTSFILGHSKSVTFIDFNELNVTKRNLSLTGNKYSVGTSKYIGVNKETENRYNVRGRDKNNAPFPIGIYEDEIISAIAYNKAMGIVRGEGNFRKNNPEISEEKYEEIYNAVSVCTKVRPTKNRDQGKNRKLGKPKSSVYTGVCIRSRYGVLTNKWIASIAYNNNNIYIGSFDSEIEAAQAYNVMALYLYGDDARVNNVPEPLHPVIDMGKVLEKISKRDKFI